MKQIFTLVCLVGCWVGSVTQGWGQAANNDATFNIGTGFNGSVRALALQSSGRVIAAGNFTSFNGTTCNSIARLDTNGSFDAVFNIGTGFNFSVSDIALQSDGKVIAVGEFTSFNGTTRNRIARLDADGALDATFAPPGTGFNSIVTSIVIQPDGKVILGGWFTSFNGTSRSRIARLNTDGSLDTGFNPGSGFNNDVYCLALQSDGKVLVGGFFSSFNGTTCNRIARLNADGSLDTGFNPGTGFNFDIRALAVQSDGKILAGGQFTAFNGSSINRIIRLNVDGSQDINFNPNLGFNNPVESILLQPDGKIWVGGFFTSFNGVASNRLVRLNANGSLDVSLDLGTGLDAFLGQD
ncbi:MAG TPA: hypothetical protein DCM08_13945 [Microscillaceae bacterium]|nr:hypothetical protein [Microscillaceae bacterium]